MTYIIILLIIFLLLLLWDNLVLNFKKGYYEQTLKNNKHKFSVERWRQIEAVFNKRNPF